MNNENWQHSRMIKEVCDQCTLQEASSELLNVCNELLNVSPDSPYRTSVESRARKVINKYEDYIKEE